MRYFFITFLLVFSTSFLLAQSPPAPTTSEIISEDDLKHGVYNAPIFDSAALSILLRPAKGQAKDGELGYVLGAATTTPLKVYGSPAVIRLQLAGQRRTEGEDVMDLLVKLLKEEADVTWIPIDQY